LPAVAGFLEARLLEQFGSRLRIGLPPAHAE
jgi:hypothetical protein